MNSMPDAAILDFHSADFRLLGHCYQNDFPLEINVNDENVELVPPKSTRKHMVAMTTTIGLIYVGFLWFVVANDVDDKFGPLIWVILFLIGAIAILGPLAAHQLRIRYLRARSPLVSYSKGRASCTILGGQKEFATGEVYALLGLTQLDAFGESRSELQLLVLRDNALLPHLITTSLASSARVAFGKVLVEFADATGVRGLIAEPDGWLNRGPLRIRELRGGQLRE